MKSIFILFFVLLLSIKGFSMERDSSLQKRNELGMDLSSLLKNTSYGNNTNFNVLYRRLWHRGNFRFRVDANASSSKIITDKNTMAGYDEYTYNSSYSNSSFLFKTGYEFVSPLNKNSFYYGTDIIVNPASSTSNGTNNYLVKGDVVRYITGNNIKTTNIGFGVSPLAGFRLFVSPNFYLCFENSMTIEWFYGSSDSKYTYISEKKDTHEVIYDGSRENNRTTKSFNITNSPLSNLSIFLCIRF